MIMYCTRIKRRLEISGSLSTEGRLGEERVWSALRREDVIRVEEGERMLLIIL
jgi:hypothetical protein